MLSWFFAGGLGMFPVLGLGLLAVGLSFCHALAPAQPWRQSASSARAAALFAALASVAINLFTVSSHLGGEVYALQAAVGLGESVTPAALAGSLAALSGLLSAAGDVRQP